VVLLKKSLKSRNERMSFDFLIGNIPLILHSLVRKESNEKTGCTEFLSDCLRFFS
jgi:hypothetical protein